MYKKYIHTIPSTNIHYILALIILIEILIIFYNSILYLSRPNDKDRLRYLTLTFLFIQYNITGGIFVDDRLPIPFLLQGAFAIFSSMLMSSYLPYYIYKTLNLKELKFYAYYGYLIFIIIPYFLIFLITLSITEDYKLSAQLMILVQFIYAIAFLYHLTKAFLYKKSEGKLPKEQLYGTYLAIIFWIIMPVVFFFNGGQIIEHLTANAGYLIMSVIFIRSNILNSRNEYFRLLNSEAELIKMNKTLEEKVVIRTKELEEANEKRINSFINLTHEIRTPLNLINNYLEEYIEKYGEKNKEIEIIKINIEKLYRDINNFFDTERFSRGIDVFNNDQVTNFSKVLNDSLELFKKYAEKKQITITDEILNDVYVKADPNAIGTLMNNLLDNAIKYTPKGGGIHTYLSRDNGTIQFSVKDTGYGIPIDKQALVFKPFVQISTEKRNNQGMGMGLSIVRSIVTNLNGNISLSSQEEEGTEIKIELKPHKLSEGERAEKHRVQVPRQMIISSEELSDSLSGRKYTILIVEDELMMLAYLRTKLKAEYNVYLAENGIVALNKLCEMSKLPDIIVSDVMMDEVNGFDFLKILSETPEYNFIPFIFITAKSTIKDKLYGLGLGAIDYIIKPFRVEELKQKIDSLLITIENQRKSFFNQVYKTVVDQLGQKPYDLSINLPTYKSKCVNYNITRREREIIELLSQELSHKEIADKLYISDRTVSKHIQNIYEKTGVNNKIDLLKKIFNNLG